MLHDQFPPQWGKLLKDASVDWIALEEALASERSLHLCYPPAGLEFEGLRLVDPGAVKVIVCGQDPYHGAGQAHGLAFSVAAGIPYPPSLRNVLRELCQDLQVEWPLERGFDVDGVLGPWAREGVLLLNDVLTVRSGEPGSHSHLGWQVLTGAILDAMAAAPQPLAVLLWGRPAQAHSARFHSPLHRVFHAPHPSPLSAHRGFFGSKPFSKANRWLGNNGVSPVNWVG